MKKKGNKKKIGGLRFYFSDEELIEYMNVPAKAKLRWLEEAREFTYAALSKEKLAIWQKFRRGEI